MYTRLFPLPPDAISQQLSWTIVCPDTPRTAGEPSAILVVDVGRPGRFHASVLFFHGQRTASISGMPNACYRWRSPPSISPVYDSSTYSHTSEVSAPVGLSRYLVHNHCCLCQHNSSSIAWIDMNIDSLGSWEADFQNRLYIMLLVLCMLTLCVNNCLKPWSHRI
jgi:hypothetical protein